MATETDLLRLGHLNLDGTPGAGGGGDEPGDIDFAKVDIALTDDGIVASGRKRLEG